MDNKIPTMKHLANIRYHLPCALLLLFLAGCVGNRINSNPTWYSLNGEEKLSYATRSRLEAEAKQKKSVEAGEQLYKYYTFSGSNANTHKSNYWLKWLAHRGVPFAQFNYGKMLIDEHLKINEGLCWMLKAQHAGYTAGDKVLDRYMAKYTGKGADPLH